MIIMLNYTTSYVPRITLMLRDNPFVSLSDYNILIISPLDYYQFTSLNNTSLMKGNLLFLSQINYLEFQERTK